MGVGGNSAIFLQEQFASAFPGLISPSSRRVRFVRPYAFPEEEGMEPAEGTAFAEAAIALQPFSEAKYAQYLSKPADLLTGESFLVS